MILLLCLLCLICGEPAWSLKNDEFSFNGDIRQVAISTNNLYIAATERFYQLWPNLTLIHNLTLRGTLKNEDQPGKESFQRVPENDQFTSTFRVNVLLPFVKNDTLISCGETGNKLCGFCEVLDLKNISKLVYNESIQVGPKRSNSRSVSFLVDVKKESFQTETYILTAIQNHTDKTECNADLKTINLHNTDHRQDGGLFSALDQPGRSSPGIQTKADVEFVDGFQINSTVYLFSNVASGGKTNKVRLIWLQAESSKAQTLESLRGATLRSSGGEGSKLLTSSVVPGGQQVLWSGVFSVDGGGNTELLLFDISPDLSREMNRDPDFYTLAKNLFNPTEPRPLEPQAVLFKKKHMNSVLAVKQGRWMVFFIATTNGQLIMLPVDKSNRPACPKEIHRASGNENMFPKILLDPVDHKQMYLTFKDKIKRVPVSSCSEYQRVEDCCTDPFCVWCDSEKERCAYKDDCKDDWLSIPDEYQQKVISHRVVKDSTGQVKVAVKVHLTVAQKLQSKFTCAISAYSRCLPQPQYPQCTCILYDHLSNELDVDVTIRFEQAALTERLKLIDCSDSALSCQQCVRAGCDWRESRCSWAREEVQNEPVCQQFTSHSDTVVKPEIISVSPSRVSYYGRNHALLKGRNLRDVAGVRVQAEMDCSSKESPVWNNTGESLTFHIPRRTNEAVVQVCALLSDGSCHGKAEITYQSAPSCTGVSPSVTWRSGKRKITITGSYLDTVEHIQLQEDFPLQLQEPPEHINSTTLVYKTPPGEPYEWRTVYIKVANETLRYSAEIWYYPDPQFITFRAKRTGDNMKIIILKRKDSLMMTTAELSIWGIKDAKQYPCILQSKDDEYKSHTGFNYGSQILVCEIRNTTNVIFNQLKVMYGETIVHVWNPPLFDQILLILRLIFLPSVAVVLMIICQCQKRRVVKKIKF